MATTETRIPLYNLPLIITDNIDELPKDCRPEPVNEDSVGSIAACVWHSRGKVYFWYDQKCVTTEIIVHESVHIKNRVFEIIGIDPNGMNDEYEAYLLQEIFNIVTNIVCGETK